MSQLSSRVGLILKMNIDKEQAIEVIGSYYDTLAAEEYEFLALEKSSDEQLLTGLEDVIKRAEERKSIRERKVVFIN